MLRKRKSAERSTTGIPLPKSARREVDDRDPPPEKRPGHGRRDRVGQCQEGGVEAGGKHLLRLPEGDAGELPAEGGKRLFDRLFGVLLGGQRRDLRARMGQQEPDEFEPGVSRRAEYSDPLHVSLLGVIRTGTVLTSPVDPSSPVV